MAIWFKHFDEFDGLDWLTFDEKLEFDQLSPLYSKFVPESSHAEQDELFEEIIQVNDNLAKISFGEARIDEKWSRIFANKNIKHLKKLVSIFLSIFPSNSFCESIFSTVNNIWTDERNRFSLDTVNALISVKRNMEIDCVDSYNFFLTQKELLDKVGHSYNC